MGYWVKSKRKDMKGRWTTPAKTRFFFQVKKLKTGKKCWKWQGKLTVYGYGTFGVAGVDTRAHRYSYNTFVRTLKPGQCVLHKCDNRWCVKPSHLFTGTLSDNNKDAVRKGRQAKGDTHGRRKLCAKQVISILKCLRTGTEFQRDIASRFGVCKGTISHIKLGTAWGHLSRRGLQ